MDIGKFPIVVALLAALSLAIIIMVFALKKIVSLSAAKSKARRFDHALEKYRARYVILETHALDYSNALASRKDNLMIELHNSIQELEGRIETVMNLVENKDASALHAANKLFNNKIVPPLEAARGSKEEVVWSDYLDKLMQAVGEAIYHASQDSRDLGLSGRGNRDTLVSLKEAGINLQKLRKSLEEEKDGYENSKLQ